MEWQPLLRREEPGAAERGCAPATLDRSPRPACRDEEADGFGWTACPARARESAAAGAEDQQSDSAGMIRSRRRSSPPRPNSSRSTGRRKELQGIIQGFSEFPGTPGRRKGSSRRSRQNWLWSYGEVQRLTAEEAPVAQYIAAEQARWTEFNRLVEELERTWPDGN